MEIAIVVLLVVVIALLVRILRKLRPQGDAFDPELRMNQAIGALTEAEWAQVASGNYSALKAKFVVQPTDDTAGLVSALRKDQAKLYRKAAEHAGDGFSNLAKVARKEADTIGEQIKQLQR